MLNEDVLKIVLNDKTFSQREAEEIVGSRGRLFKLIGSGGIRAEKIPSLIPQHYYKIFFLST